MKPKFKKGVDAGDLAGTRLFLANEMLLDPRGKSFNEMRTYAETAFSNLYDVHDGGSFEQNKAAWSKDLLNNVQDDLESNFSRERLDFYYNLAKEVLKDKAEYLDAEDIKLAQRQSNTSTNREEYIYPSDSKKKIHTGITIGGAALTVAGLFIEKTAVAYAVSSLGIIGMAVGGYLLYNDRKK
ncbi:hypothetical protein DW204_14410 [Phocaeicola plebeius]|uniref:Uncharacterized protein n=1 Tax=Phocaeicola plebeius TaxID=310297 RepID=A0A414WQD5_9BACT|nr:hypothetical protein [Phocaeicola plebeius]RHH39038.1 hypothetical protein DW204_14410 [Phocaeicola plebeius]